ncbi:MAG: DUF1801 domain-containing protein [Eubacteriaceae bacterium]
MTKEKNKTVLSESDPMEFINSIENEKKKKFSYKLLELMEKTSGDNAKMWGDSIIGFSKYHYKYASGREGDWFKIGFSPRKQNMTIYLTYGFEDKKDIMSRLGKYKTGKACIYINKLKDIDIYVLEELIRSSLKDYEKES